jgi:prepilin-type N-terminal cleavage/methylation domain-containing protein
VTDTFFVFLQTILRYCSTGLQTGRDRQLLSIVRPDHNTARLNRQGYTLLELIVVIVLLGLIFGLTVPKFRQALLSDSLDATSLRMIGLVQNLREQAIRGQEPYTLHIDIRSNKVWSFPSSASEEEQVKAGKRAYTLPPDVQIQDIWSSTGGKLYDEAVIRFSKKGYVEQSVIHLKSEDGREFSLELYPFLGSIKIHEGYVDTQSG